ncbi:MAG: PaaI family thioesterase [Ilumatobacteraceae bacterium]|jgi:uncharacterized protein (TIGR00369 family)|nr:PaaI family thioesterase [Ilumatobacteraceae bacterium]
MSRADRFAALDEATARRWARFGRQEQVLYPNLLGLVVEEVRVDYCRMRLPFRPELLQAGGVVHGGAIASLLDAVLVPAVGAALPPRARYSTVDLHVQYLGALTDADAVAEGWVTKRGRNLVFCESEAVDAVAGRVVARAVLTYFVAS